uniref:UV DNA damage repair endonuclease UvsE n=1 Tax=Candidatus Methanomethylicus mesodigestus TaxID=1867258 RepID=A0A7C3IW99_9CREN
MRIGYPCVNTSLGCSSSHTFRLASYSEEKLVLTVRSNLDCLKRILNFNAQNGILFFRITSDLVPFASHPINTFDWAGHFSEDFSELGRMVRESGMRISMHPDQFVLINAKDEGVFRRSVMELDYHVKVLDLMALDASAKVQIHLGGVYNDRESSIRRFVDRYKELDHVIKRRLVVENDDVNYGLADCLDVSRMTGLPVIFDSFHHSLKGNGESLAECLEKSARTWRADDGIPMVDYSSHAPGQNGRKHAPTLDEGHFRRFLEDSRPFDFDLMLEIKDKERSALRALRMASADPRFCRQG